MLQGGGGMISKQVISGKRTVAHSLQFVLIRLRKVHSTNQAIVASSFFTTVLSMNAGMAAYHTPIQQPVQGQIAESTPLACGSDSLKQFSCPYMAIWEVD